MYCTYCTQQSISNIYTILRTELLFLVWDENDKTWEEASRAAIRNGEEEESKASAGWHTGRVFQGVDANCLTFNEITFYLSARFGMTTARLTRPTNFSGRRMLTSTRATFLLQHTWVKRRWRGRNRMKYCRYDVSNGLALGFSNHLESTKSLLILLSTV